VTRGVQADLLADERAPAVLTPAGRADPALWTNCAHRSVGHLSVDPGGHFAVRDERAALPDGAVRGPEAVG
jgi:hypothetical protein